MLPIDFQHFRHKMGATVDGDTSRGQADIIELPLAAEHAAEPIGEGEVLPRHQCHVGALPSETLGMGGNVKMAITVADEYDVGLPSTGLTRSGAIFIGKRRAAVIGR
ncbi:hypothetical protein BTW08_06490 [Salinicola sp. MH3R3-1]|nr:hypothetical protein BTW08_06490 [Salinicola sp. MH3R3-1]